MKSTYTTVTKLRKEIQQISRTHGIDELKLNVYVVDEWNDLTSDLQVEIVTEDEDIITITYESIRPEKEVDFWNFVETGLERHKTSIKKITTEFEKYNIEIDDSYSYTC